MNSPYHLLYLADVGRNSATFAVSTEWNRSLDTEREVRIPTLVSSEIIKKALYALDKAASVIDDWPVFYSWLGRGSGWALFSPESARRIIPAWVCNSVEYECISFRRLLGWIDFVDATIDPDAFSSINNNLVGPSVEDDAYQWFRQLTSNLILTRQPLFQD